jgi:hypothetical protein
MRVPVYRAICAPVLFVTLQSTGLAQQQFPYFKITGYEGYVSAGAQSDSSTIVTPGLNNTQPTTRTEKQTDDRIEASVMTHGYIYHPKFMQLDIGVGLVSAISTTQNDDVKTRNREPLYNFSLHAAVLPEKPLHGTFFYEHINSTPPLDSGGSFNQLNNKYGFTVASMAPLSPVAVDLAVTREENDGSGATRFVNDHINRITLNASRSIADAGLTQLSYQIFQQDSSSGSTNLPIYQSKQDSQAISIDTRLKLGKERNYDVNNRIEYSTQKYELAHGPTPQIDDLRFQLGFRGIHGSDWITYANYQAGRNQQDTLTTSTDSANGGVTWSVTKNWDVSGGLHSNKSVAPQLSADSRGIDGSTRYQKALPIGTGTVNYNLRYEQQDQTANAAQINIVGERLSLTQTNWVNLTRTRVTGGSVTVRNSSRTQLFIENIDYILSVVGKTTRVQRLISGSILDGEVVLVDYGIDTGGTYSSTQFDQGLGLTWTVSRLLEVYFRYAESTPTVTSGEPSNPLLEFKSRLYGLRSNVPLFRSFDMSLVTNLEREDRQDSEAPFVRTDAEMYVHGEAPIGLANNYQIGTRRTRVTADIAAQSVEQTSYDMTFGIRVSNALTVSTTALIQHDSGGLEKRDRKTATIRALWRYRKLSISADLARTNESQGSYSRDRTFGHLTVRRDF